MPGACNAGVFPIPPHPPPEKHILHKKQEQVYQQCMAFVMVSVCMCVVDLLHRRQDEFASCAFPELRC